MQDKHLYEYAVIRVVPRVERDEFVNAGIVLFCKKEKFIKVIFKINEEKLLLFCKDIDVEQIQNNLISFEKIAHGNPNGGPIALMDLAERFRWLTAVRSSVIQTSRPHPGLSINLEQTAKRLFEEMVL
ncbi:MAG: DUF3037 domain-containing protein [Bacteroidetes bacterium]|nr:DUF3037 domain-containing protein [Bacteroidota bacterium]